MVLQQKLLTCRIALKDIPSDLCLSCTWYTPTLSNRATELTAQRYHLLPQAVSDLTKQVDAKYIISVVQLQQEDSCYILSDEYFNVLSAYIKETAVAFAPQEAVVPASQPAPKKAPVAKRKGNSSLCPPSSSTTMEVEGYTVTKSTTSSGGLTKTRHF